VRYVAPTDRDVLHAFARRQPGPAIGHGGHGRGLELRQPLIHGALWHRVGRDEGPARLFLEDDPYAERLPTFDQRADLAERRRRCTPGGELLGVHRTGFVTAREGTVDISVSTSDRELMDHAT